MPDRVCLIIIFKDTHPQPLWRQPKPKKLSKKVLLANNIKKSAELMVQKY